jgi:hypothetical protein
MVMLCVWWNQKEITYYELLEPKQTVKRLSEALQKNDFFHAKGHFAT